ncbi:hypothetical protein SH449x_003427 [Pirellulaceae bacterium SH449]
MAFRAFDGLWARSWQSDVPPMSINTSQRDSSYQAKPLGIKADEARWARSVKVCTLPAIVVKVHSVILSSYNGMYVAITSMNSGNDGWTLN